VNVKIKKYKIYRVFYQIAITADGSIEEEGGGEEV